MSAKHELHGATNTRIPKRWLLVAWLPLFAMSALTLVIYIIGTPVYLVPFYHPYSAVCIDMCQTARDTQSLHTLGISITGYALYWLMINLLFTLTYLVVAALIFWRKSSDWMALLAAFSLVAMGASFPDIPAPLAIVHPVWSLPAAFLNENLFAFPTLVFFLFLFPNGRFVPRWTLWIAVGFTILSVGGSLFPGSPFDTSNWPILLDAPVVFGVYGLLVLAQIYRYRHVSTPIERQQTKWVVLGATVALLGFLLLGYLLGAILRTFTTLQSIGLIPYDIGITVIYLVLLLIPISLGIAILRYRLWDVDVLINKVLVYGLLTGMLLAVYAGCIIGLETLLRTVFQQGSDLAVVASTLVIAALFQPLRRYIQAGIDRRFFRRKYDSARILAGFSATLRSEVELKQVSEQLIAVVQETMQPAHVSLWLRDVGSSGRQDRG